MLFNENKPYRVVEVAKGSQKYYIIEQPVKFIWRVKFKAIEHMIKGIYPPVFTTKTFTSKEEAVTWAEERLQPIVRTVVHGNYQNIPDYKFTPPAPSKNQ